MSKKKSKERGLQILSSIEIKDQENTATPDEEMDELIELEDMLDELEGQLSTFRHSQSPETPPMKLSFHNGMALD